MRKQRLIEAVRRVELEAAELARLCAEVSTPIRYAVARPGCSPEPLTYPTEEIASLWAGPRDRVVPVHIVGGRLDALDEIGAAALEGVFLAEGEVRTC